MHEIDISGLSPADVVAALYNYAEPQGLGWTQYDPARMTPEQAQLEIERVTNLRPDPSVIEFDYLKGRVMKIRICNHAFDPTWYDRDNGQGAAADIIATLRARKGVPA